MIKFFLSVAKLAAALTITIVVLAVSAWVIVAFVEYRENVKNAPLEMPKTWNPQTVGALENSKLSLVTKWHDGHMYYQFEMESYPSSLFKYREDAEDYDCYQIIFTLTFLDENGFKLSDYQIPSSELIRIVDDSRKPIGLSARGDTYMSADTYRKAVKWEVNWSN